MRALSQFIQELLLGEYANPAFYVFVAAAALIVLGGLGYLLFKRSRFDLGQLFVGVLTVAVVLAALRTWHAEYCMLCLPEEFHLTALRVCILAGVGMFIGARNSRLMPEARPWVRWAIYIAGVLLPLTIVPIGACLERLFHGFSVGGLMKRLLLIERSFPIAFPVLLLLCIPWAVTIAAFVVAHRRPVREFSVEPGSEQPRRRRE